MVLHALKKLLHNLKVQNPVPLYEDLFFITCFLLKHAIFDYFNSPDKRGISLSNKYQLSVILQDEFLFWLRGLFPPDFGNHSQPNNNRKISRSRTPC